MRILVALLLVLWSTNAEAIPITNGFLFTGAIIDFGPFMSASGPGLSLSSSALQGTVNKDDAPFGFATPLNAGTLTTLNSTALLTGGTATLGNQSHSLVQQQPSVLRFITESFALPIVPQNTSVSLPFTMSGTLNLDGPGNALTIPLTGAGFATGTFMTGGIPSMFLSAVRYDFTDIPEPSTVVLVGSGVAALIWRYRKLRTTVPTTTGPHQSIK
jgi:hypothetical protein